MCKWKTGWRGKMTGIVPWGSGKGRRRVESTSVPFAQTHKQRQWERGEVTLLKKKELYFPRGDEEEKKRLGYEMPQNVPASVLARCSVVEATEQFTWNIWAISSGEVAANWRGKWGTLIMHRNSCTNRITLKYCNCSGRPSLHMIFSSFSFFCSRPSAQIVIKTKVYKRRGITKVWKWNKWHWVCGRYVTGD